MATLVDARDRYVAEYERLARHDRPADPAWLRPLRRAAIARFAEAGFPTTRDEDWRYTSLAALAATPFGAAPEADGDGLPAEIVERLVLGGGAWPRLVFVDGRYSARHSSVPAMAGGARAVSLAAAMGTDRGLVEGALAGAAGVFADLNTAFVHDGALVVVPAGARLPAPIELLFVSRTPGIAIQPRIVVVAGPHSQVSLVERYVGLTGEPYFTNTVTGLTAGPGATVDHYVLQEQGAEAFHVATSHATLERDSAVATCGVAFGGRLARTTLTMTLAGPGARATLRGLYVVGGRQHVDNHLTVDHAVPHGVSRQLYKGVLDGQARAVFNGRILVRPDAQKTDAAQTNKHLLLSDGVEVDSKPQLEIFADDVKCTHGAAEGQLAPEALFYLRSRGLDEATARGLLTYGFAREVLEHVAIEPIRAHVDHLLTARLRPSPAPEEIA